MRVEGEDNERVDSCESPGMGVTAGYNGFVERHLAVLTMKGSVTEIVSPWPLMIAGAVVFWTLRPRPKTDG